MRRLFLQQCALAALTLTQRANAQTTASPRMGILMIHGKTSPGTQDPNLGVLRAPLERQGWKVLLPDMPWSRQRYLEGNWDRAMDEITAHVKTLRAAGAERIVHIGHSMGCPASMSFAARGGDVDALVLLAPGHVPKSYYRVPGMSVVHDSVEEARELVRQGKTSERQRFADINQGRRLSPVALPQDYLSYFEPESDAEMSVTAPRIPPRVPVFTAIGENDPLFSSVRRYFYDLLPPNTANRLLEVGGGHLDTPRLASEQIVAWIQENVAR